MASALSVDLLDCVLHHLAPPLADHVYDLNAERANQRELRAASLVCRRWAEVAQRQLGWTVIVETLGDAVRLEQASPFDLARVQSLTVELAPASVASVNAVHGVERHRAYAIVEAVINGMSALRVTRISDAAVARRHAPDMRWGGEALVVQALEWRDWATEEPYNDVCEWLASSLTRSPSVNRFSLLYDSSSATDTHPCPFDASVCGRLTALSLGWIWEGVVVVAGNFPAPFFPHTLASLQSLRIHLDYWHRWHGDDDEEAEDAKSRQHDPEAREVFGVRGCVTPCLESLWVGGSVWGFAVAFAAICIDLPPTLRHLELDGVLRRAAPTFTSALLNAVEAPHILPQLERLGVRLDWCPEELVEAAEGGRQLQIDLGLLGPACAKRGIRCDIEVDWPTSSSA